MQAALLPQTCRQEGWLQGFACHQLGPPPLAGLSAQLGLSNLILTLAIGTGTGLVGPLAEASEGAAQMTHLLSAFLALCCH